MLYQDADDQVLEQDIYLDLNEAERVGSSPNVHIVAQIDRFRAGFQGDGNWTSARRYYVVQDNDLHRVGSKLVQELGEVDMSDPQTLVDFVQWSVKNFPADKYVLILSDHGLGWPGGWSDPSHRGATQSTAPLTTQFGNNLYLMELDQALGQARAAAGIDKFEVVGLDACLMGQLEVMAAIQPHANYAIASEEVEPAIGWAYAGFLSKLVQNPNMSGADLSRAIVESYIVGDQRIQDPA
ncbi:MAG: clostripain-related cysteine peptidase, partial [Desulfofundulus sp.]